MTTDRRCCPGTCASDDRHCLAQPKLKVFILLVTFGFSVVLLERYVTPDRPYLLSVFEQRNDTDNGWLVSLLTRNTKAAVVDGDDPACVYPEVDPFHPNIMRLAGLDKKPFDCDGYLPDLTYVDGDKLIIDGKKVKAVANFTFCKYREIFKIPAKDKTAKLGSWSDTFKASTKLPDRAEFLLAVCENKASEIVSRTYHALTPQRDDLKELELLRLNKRQKEAGPKETLNVVMVGMDGTSRHQFIRAMNRTYAFLMEGNTSFDLSMYTQVGINTFPNYLPLLSGYNDDEVHAWWSSSKHLDPLDLIWKDFSQAGYRTLYTEDEPSIGGFHFAKKGFMFSPTDHYSHPISVAMEEDKDLWREGDHCAGGQPEINFHFNYMTRFMDAFADKPVYAMSFFTKLTHGEQTNNRRADDLTYRFYKALQDKGHLNRTLLITFSDHGPRWGSIRPTLNGMVESRAPYAILTFPRWFLDKYPDVAENLRTNTRRLTTHYDTHATLQDLIYFKAKGTIPLVPGKHGISLFKEIPKSRTCEGVPIPPEFCLCGHQQMEPVSTNSSMAQGLGDVVVRAINSKRTEKLCVALRLKETLQVYRIKLPRLGSDDKRVYKVKIQTIPGDAVYEGTIQTDKCEDKELLGYFEALRAGNTTNPLDVTVGDAIDRFTMYKGQADCEKEASKKPYCYCKDLIKS
ncbi:unnamed protein product [Lymnaea stagnalis]|uniref:Sulfatase N-terminal domain-containing protein n=1 Tax=Lymnaea stagnalis TaxID=6523 RepID=A0AAV2HS06_LYMST